MAKLLRSGSEYILFPEPAEIDAARAWFDPDSIQRNGWLERVASGRGDTWLFRAGGHALALRHARRGGQLAKWLGDRYLWRGLRRTRAMSEHRLLAALSDWRLPAPAPFAARVVRQGLWYRCDLITRQVGASASLAERLERGVSERHWRAVGRCIAAVHRRRVWHADLNAHNVLLADSGAAYLVDFDRARIRRSAWPAARWRRGNLRRLRRSVRKLSGGRFPERGWRSLLEAYREALAQPSAPTARGAPVC